MEKTIEYYNDFHDYDKSAEKCSWVAPEILWNMVLKFTNPKPAQWLLDIGIGTGLSSILPHQAGLKIIGVDGAKERLGDCEKKNIAKILKVFDLLKLKERNLPVPHTYFEYVISCGALYFIRDLQLIFKESARVLKPNGYFCFNIEPADADNKNSQYQNYDNDKLIKERYIGKTGVKVYMHSKKYIERLAMKSGFKIISSRKDLSYYSPTENRNVYFETYLMKKI